MMRRFIYRLSLSFHVLRRVYNHIKYCTSVRCFLFWLQMSSKLEVEFVFTSFKVSAGPWHANSGCSAFIAVAVSIRIAPPDLSQDFFQH